MQRIGSALVISLMGSSAFADAPPAVPIVVDMVTVNGTGCPANTAAVGVTPDNTAIWVVYSSYVAAIGVGSGPVDFRKNCLLNVRVHAPPGFTYAIAGVDYSGGASLAAGASAVLRTTLFFQGQPAPAFVAHSLSGPFDDLWWFSDTVDSAALVFAPCDSQPHLNLATEIRVTLGTSDPATTSSFMAMDGIETAPHMYHLVWKRCD